jgi:hypothetical protein
MSEARALIRGLSGSTVWGGHIIFGLGISGPPQLANFLCGQLKGKKLGQMPSQTCDKERVAHIAAEPMQGGV